MNDFYQTPPRLGNSFEGDRVLRSYLRRALPAEMLAEIEPGLHALGARATGEMLALADAAEANPPRHVPYDAWGRRVDRIETSDAWRALDRIAAEEGIVATAYERAHGAWSRVHQFARLHLYHPSSAIYSCPLAMTDGAARVLTLHGGGDPVLAAAVGRLTTRDPTRFWTSGQWMTERSGGSDVSGTATLACQRDTNQYALTGTKWFTSATTSQMALTLARIDDRTGEGDVHGGAGLSVFYIELRDETGALRGIRVNRLKDKLGTRALPTAELTLDQTPARLVGGPGHGVRKIAALLNVTRYYNAVCSASGMRRAIALASDYATRRVAFGRPLAQHPLHVETLATMEAQYAAALHLAARLAELLGRDETGEATEDEKLLLRLLTPAVKAFTGKQAVAVASEALEAFGGAGYIEDTGLPRLLRDAQVLSIWEGTTNVLALDVLRVLGKGGGAPLEALLADVERRLAGVDRGPLVDAAAGVRDGLRRILVHAAVPMPDDSRQASARAFTFAIARTYAGALLIEQAAWGLEADDDVTAVETALRWCARDLAPLPAVIPQG